MFTLFGSFVKKVNGKKFVALKKIQNFLLRAYAYWMIGVYALPGTLREWIIQELKIM